MKSISFAFAGFMFCQQICFAASPSVSLHSPTNETVALHASVVISSSASDADGDMTEHNLDVQRPDGQWNWEGGWSIQWPFQGGVSGDGHNSSKSASFVFNEPGTWHVRAAAADASDWSHSNTVEITVVESSAPSVSLTSPSGQSVALDTALTISANASDADGNLIEHNLDVQRPDGQWNWEGGWSTQWPFLGGVNGDGYNSSKSASFTFDQPGVWHVRSAAWDGTTWSYSNTAAITVFGINPPSVSLSSPSNQTVALNTVLTISTNASDPDGNMTEHNLDVQRPDGQWNWEGGWSTQWPFQGGVNGNGYASSKSASFTFNQPGVWHVRATASDGPGWSYSNTVEITVNPPVSTGHINIPTTISVVAGTVSFSINDNGIVSGSHTNTNGYEGDYYVHYVVREPRAGPGYVTWYQEEAFERWQSPSTNYFNHDQMLARYVRSTRSWIVTKVGSFRTGWLTSWEWGWQTPLTLALTHFSYRTDWNYHHYPYTAYEQSHSYSIPTQPL